MTPLHARRTVCILDDLVHGLADEPTETLTSNDSAFDAPSDQPVSAVSGTWALFVGLGLLMIGNGLNGALIGVRSATEGFSVLVAGVVMAGYFAGFLIAPSFVARTIPSVGHIRVFAGLASTASSAVLIHSVTSDAFTWTAMRFLFGFCMSGLYIVIESWLGEMTDATNRGRTMAIYMIVSMGGLGVGQYFISFADPNGFVLFVVSSTMVSMSLVPMTLAATTKAPNVRAPEPLPIRELWRLAPTGVVGTLMSGAAAGILFGLAAVYAATIDLSLDRTAFFLIAPMIGAIVFQWPIGRLSDKVQRRAVIYGVAAIASATAAVLAVLPSQSWLVPVLMIGLGGTAFPLYSLVISFTLDWTPPGKTVGASSSLVRINGIGALIGPLATAPLMQVFGARFFFFALAVVFGIVVVYVTYRIMVRDAMPVERQRAFVPFPARASAVASGLIVKPVRKVTKAAVDGQRQQRRATEAASESEPQRGRD